jgi:DNA-binding CsgD family transcriptional regulator
MSGDHALQFSWRARFLHTRSMPQVLCPVVIGRDAELRHLEEALTEARGGFGAVAFVVGEAGIGKSRLLREAATRATDRGMTALTGRAVRGGARVPHRPLMEAVQSWTRAHGPPDDAALDPYRSALGWLIPEWKPRVSPAVSPVTMMEAVVRLLGAIAGTDGLLLCLDDLHWADADTLATLEYLADNLVTESVLCLCALRSDEPGHAGRVAEGLVSRRAASRLVLRRLGDSEVNEMINTTLPSVGNQLDQLDQLDLEALRTRAEGVPFLVEEMLSEYATLGRLSLPASFEELVRARMTGLNPSARDVIHAAAAIGRDFDWTVVAAITGLDRTSVLAALRAAIAVQLITSDGGDDARFRFRHALIQEAIAEDLLAPERTELYRRAAGALEKAFPGLSGELCQVTADLYERAGDRTEATRLLLEVARRALTSTALATAEAALWRALELAEGDRWRTMGIHRLLVEVLSLSGKTSGLKEIGDAALGFFRGKSFVGGPLQFSDLHLQIARGLATTAEWTDVDRHLERARRWAKRGEHPQQLARIQAFRAHVLISRGEIQEAEGLATRAGQTAVGFGLHEVVCEALRAESRAALFGGDPSRAAQTLERAKLIADREGLTFERAMIHLALARIDRLTTLEGGDAESARELSERIGAIALEAEIDIEVAARSLELFDLAVAAEASERAVTVCRQHGLGLLPLALVTHARVFALSIERKGMERTLEELSGTSGAEPAAVAAGEARAVFHLLRDERARALAALDAAVEATEEGFAAFPWPFHGMRALVKAVEGASVGDVEPSPVSPGVLSHAGNRGLYAAAEAVRLGREGKAREAGRSVAQARALLRPFVWRESLALRLLAEAGLADGWGEPARWAEESLRFFESAGLDRVAAACRGLLRRAGVRVSRKGGSDSEVPASLAALGVTTREADVLRLVGEGLSNAEIAERLFVSIRTVETHASRLLRKVGLKSRPQLVVFANRVQERVESQTKSTGS